MNLEKKRKKVAILMWVIMVITYMFNTFHAVSMGAIKEDLTAQFNLSESNFILLANAFSYSYMIMQIPVGILLDKWGAKKTSVAGNALASLGVLLFAIAPNFGVLFLGRALIGVGCSVCFLSILKFCAEWFDPKIFCTMTGVTTFIGMAGALFAQTPLSILTKNASISTVFIGIAVFTVLIVGLEVIFVKDKPSDLGLPNLAKESEQGASVPLGKAVLGVLKNKRTWPPLVAYGCFYGTYLIISGIYGTGMIASAYNSTSIVASGCISYAVLGCAVGGVLVGWVSDKIANRAKTQIVCGICFVLSFIALKFSLGMVQLPIICVIMFLLGFFSCAYCVCWSCVKEVNHPNFTGITTAIANMGGYLGSILVPTVVGQVYSNSTNPGDYNNVILTTIVFAVIGVVVAIFVKETKGQNIYEEQCTK